MRILVVAAAGMSAVVLLGAAALPQAMRGPGLWEVSLSASGAGGEKMCLADSGLLAQWEHRRRQCTRVVISATGDRAEVHYTCVGGGFGSSKIQVLTPRAVRISTQGISDNAPFAYMLHARRIANCSPH